jgi:DNA-binding NarL/FixJ family response regulator
MISILLVDDQTLLRDGLQTMINLQEDMRVVDVAGDGEQALLAVKSWKPDVVLMDIQMPRMNGITCTRLIKQELPTAKVIILTTFAEDDYIVESFQAGACGFLMKDLPGNRLIQSIREAAAGELLLPAKIASRIIALLNEQPTAKKGKLQVSRMKAAGIMLSEREQEIAEQLIDGRSNRQIAMQLYMSEGTVRNYISSIYNKIGTSDRDHAIELLRGYILLT